MRTDSEAHPSPSIPPMLALAVAILAASTSSIFIRFAQVLAPSMVIATYRIGLASLALWPFAVGYWRDELRSLTRRQVVLILAAGLFLAAHFATWITSLEYTSVASSVVLVATLPLFVALLAPLLLHEPLTRAVAIGLVVSFIGSILVGLSDVCTISAGLDCPPLASFIRGEAMKGDLLALAGAIAGAGYMMIGRRMRSALPLVPYITLVYSTAALALLPVTILSGYALVGYPIQAYKWFALLALLPQLLAHSTYNWALGYLPAAYVSVTVLGEPVSSILLALVFLDEVPTAIRLIGGTLVLTGIALASIKPAANARSKNPRVQIG